MNRIILYLIFSIGFNLSTFAHDKPDRFSLHSIFNYFSNDPHRLQAYVRTTKGISDQEADYINKRAVKNKSSIENLFQTKLPNKVPRIAFCCSGGGYRAMIATLGFMMGAQSTGLLDCASYISCLSGSTWAMALWAESGIPVDMTMQYLADAIKKNLFSKVLSPSVITTVLLKKYYHNQSISFIDLYGALLAQTLLKHGACNPQKITLSMQEKLFNEQADWIYPIYTSSIVCPKNLLKGQWMEYTPHEIGSEYLGCYIPTWALGRKFSNGQSINNAKSESLGYLMGIWGSAFSANMREVFENYKHNINNKKVIKIINKLLAIDAIGDARITKSRVHNFGYVLQGCPLNNCKNLTLLDGGLICNLPIAPLLKPERNVDIIVILDASANLENMPELHKAANYFKERNIKFPNLSNYTGTEWCKVFRDTTDHTCPVIIYMPLIKNLDYSMTFDPVKECRNGFCRTSKFYYASEEINLLSGLSKFNLKMNMNIILEAIKDTIASKC